MLFPHSIPVQLAADVTQYAIYSDAIVLCSNEINRTSTSSHSNMAFDAFVEGSNTFYISPNANITSSTLLLTQFLASALYTCCIFALGDDKNAPRGAGMNAFIVGLLIVVICTAFPYNSSTCLSPARDFGPRLLVLIIWR